MQSHTFAIASPIGYWTVTSSDTQVLSLDWEKEPLSPSVRTEPKTRLEQQAACMLSRYFRGEPVDFSRIPVAYPSPENLVARVMARIRTIPYGQVHAYQWLASELGNEKAARAVGGALGRNPVPVIVPCHRIVAKHNRIGGFMQNEPEGGRIKRFLLTLEGHHFNEDKLVQTPDLRPSIPFP